MKKTYDIFVIGTGVAGSKIASACSKAGKKVGICDNREFGGTCALRGCNPKKVLTGFAEAQSRFQGYKEKGVIKGETEIDWEKLISFKQQFTKNIPAKRIKSYTQKNIDTFKGIAKFIDRNQIKIGDQEVKADIIVIATGATPRKMNIPGEELLITSDEFLNLTALPSNILFIGGGYISFELAHIASQAGANVIMLERSSKPLSNFDSDLVDLLVANFKEHNIQIVTETNVDSIRKEKGKFLVETGSGKVYSTDLVVHGAGRVPNIKDLDLKKGGVEVDKHGILLNSDLQSSSNGSVYVAGDAVSDPRSIPLTPVASLEARTVIHNILNNDNRKPDYTGTPSVLYTFPPLARTGLLVEDAENENIDYQISYGDTSNDFSTRRLGLKKSAYKILIDKNDSKIIGAHLLGHHVDEVINIFGLAIRNNFTVQKLKDNIWSFPSVGDIINNMLDI
ncbi:MAG: NAD(P)/FAD-dependent oxidoreductase [Candidatus Cloacimonetes bacterium]|nr:NAD(P)/FAD-dependent oxidoreductase [Candidatus Cloacimonadota bacterium]